ncbi:MAG: hypothetical protein ACR2FY_17220 [Pirellulaceae bacterium]
MTANADSPALAIRPLSILHLLVWTTFTALFLASVSDNSLQLPPTEQASRIVSLSLYGLIAMTEGAALTGMVFLLPFLLSNSGRRRLEPGHWILIAWGTIGIGELLCNAGMRIWLVWDDEVSSMVSLNGSYYLILHGAAGVALAFGWRIGSFERPWSVYFVLKIISAGALGLAGIVQTILYFGFSLAIEEAFEPFTIIFALILIVLCVGSILEVVAFVTFVVAAIRDRNAGRHRDWLHRVAVVLVMTWPAIITIIWFGERLIYYLSDN